MKGERMGTVNRYRLAEGVVLSIGSRRSRLADLKDGRRVQVSDDVVPLLQAAASGGAEVLDPALVPFVEDRLVVDGPDGPDAFLRQRLLQLDGEHLGWLGAELPETARTAYERVLEAHSARKLLWPKVGQCPVLPETALRRALLVGDAAVVGKKRVLCLGDDDLVSVALATLGHEVVSVDMDDDLLVTVSSRP
jgi:hypothetical protein